MVFAAIEFNLLLEVIWVSLLAGVAVTAIFSLVIYGTGRALDARREGAGGAVASAWVALASVAFLLFIALLAFAIQEMVAK